MASVTPSPSTVTPAGDPTESINQDVFDLAIENAFRVGQALVDEFTG